MITKVTKKNHLLVKVEEEKDDMGNEKVGSIYIPLEKKNLIKEYKIAEILKVSKILTDEYKDLYKEGDKVVIHPATKGSKIRDAFLVPMDVIFGKL